MFATSKLFFAYALGNALLIPLYVGARTYLQAAWPEPAGVRRVLESFAPTLFFSVPTFYGHLLRADLPRDAFRSVRACVLGRRAAAGRGLRSLAPAIRRGDPRRAGHQRDDLHGAVEPARQEPRGLGRHAGAGQRGRLLDADERPRPRGEPGVLHVRTPSASAGYWNRLDASRRTFIGSGFGPATCSPATPTGSIYHASRDDDRFKVAGMWVTPTDVEAALLSHPGVAEAGVVGTALEGGLVKAVAFVVPRSAADGDGLAEALAAHRPRDCRRTSGRGRFTSWTNCHGPPPASSSATSCASGPSNDRWTTPARTTPARPRRGEGVTVEHTSTVQVRWGDVDAAGIVFYPRFYEWYDYGCEALFASLGLPWPQTFPSTGSSACPSWNRAPAFRRRRATATRWPSARWWPG